MFKLSSYPLDQRPDVAEDDDLEDAPLLSEPHGEHKAHLPVPDREAEIAQVLEQVSERLQAAMQQELAIIRRELLQRRR